MSLRGYLSPGKADMRLRTKERQAGIRYEGDVVTGKRGVREAIENMEIATRNDVTKRDTKILSNHKNV